MNTLNHAVAPEDIMALLDHELTAEQARAVQAHLAECPNCARLAEDLQLSSTQLAAWNISPLPQPIETAVLEAATLSTQGNPVAAPRSRTHWKLLVGAGAALATVVFVFAMFSPRQYGHNFSTFATVHHDKLYATPEKQLDFKASLAAPAPKIPPPPPKPAAAGGLVTGALYSSSPDQASQTQEGEVSTSKQFIGEGAAPPPPVALPNQLKGLTERSDRVVQSSLVQPMIARSVSLAIDVQNLDNSRSLLDAILAQHAGFAAQLNVTAEEFRARTLTASLRIPSTELAAALVQLKALGHVQNETQSGEEVSEQHADLAARLQNARATEARLRGILEQRTGSLSDVLEVEEEISTVREQIESMQADQKGLEHRVSYATVDLQLNQPYKAPPEAAAPPISTQLHKALLNGLTNAGDTLLSLFLFAEEYGPAILIWLAILGLPTWFLLRRRYNKLRSRL